MSTTDEQPFGWLIEQEIHFPRHRWLRLDYDLSDGVPQPARIGWTENANLALRFGRREDARLFALLHPDACRQALFTSHSFGLAE